MQMYGYVQELILVPMVHAFTLVLVHVHIYAPNIFTWVPTNIHVVEPT